MKNLIAFFLMTAAMTASLIAQAGPQADQSVITGNGGFKQEGMASWYGEEFAGRKTASGDVFDPKQLTAAHRTLPFGTTVTVTNTDNGKQVQVRINDRGPYAQVRVIDVSKAAAEKLDMLVSGTANVVIETSPSSFAPSRENVETSAASPEWNAASAYTDGESKIDTETSASSAAAAPPPAASNAATAPAAATQANIENSAAQQPRTPPVSPREVTSQRYSPTPQPNLPRSAAQLEPRAPVPATAVAQPAQPNAAQANQVSPVQQHSQNPNTWKPAVAPAPAEAPIAAAPPATPVPQSSAAQTVKPPVVQTPTAAPATILGGPIVPGRIYRIQVGSFREASNAMKAYNKLTAAGFNPQWERYENIFRVVLTGVKTEEIPLVATKLGAAGFKEALARLESIDAAQ